MLRSGVAVLSLARRGRRIRAAFFACLTAIAWLGPMSAVAGAHAELETTDPTADALIDRAPDAVTLRFSDRVEGNGATIQVLGPDGQRVDEGRAGAGDDDSVVVAPFDGTARGSYTASWRVVSGDGHQLSGSFVFHVGERTGAPSPGEDHATGVRAVAGVGRWLAFGGTLLAAGLLLFSGVVLREWSLPRRPLRTGVLLAAAVAAVASAVVLVSQVALSTGRGMLDALDLVPDAVRETRYGRLAVVRILSALAVMGVVLLPKRVSLRGAALLPALVLLAVPAAAGHAWSTSPAGLAVTTDLVHVTAVALWVGGLVGLLLLARTTTALGPPARRFSAVALAAVVVVAASGTVSGWLQVRSLDALVETAYGKLLLAKVALFLVLVAVGWLNRARWLPQVERSSALLTSVKAEIVVATVVVGLTALLVNRVPAREDLVRPFDETIQDDAGSVQLTVEPARLGENIMHLYFYDRSGAPRAVDAAELSVQSGSVAPRRIELEPVTASHFSAYGAALGARGTWRITVTSVREGAPSSSTFEVPVR